MGPKMSSIVETILFVLVQLQKNLLEMIWNAFIFLINRYRNNRFRIFFEKY